MQHGEINQRTRRHSLPLKIQCHLISTIGRTGVLFPRQKSQRLQLHGGRNQPTCAALCLPANMQYDATIIKAKAAAQRSTIGRSERPFGVPGKIQLMRPSVFTRSSPHHSRRHVMAQQLHLERFEQGAELEGLARPLSNVGVKKKKKSEKKKRDNKKNNHQLLQRYCSVKPLWNPTPSTHVPGKSYLEFRSCCCACLHIKPLPNIMNSRPSARPDYFSSERYKCCGHRL